MRAKRAVPDRVSTLPERASCQCHLIKLSLLAFRLWHPCLAKEGVEDTADRLIPPSYSDDTGLGFAFTDEKLQKPERHPEGSSSHHEDAQQRQYRLHDLRQPLDLVARAEEPLLPLRGRRPDCALGPSRTFSQSRSRQRGETLGRTADSVQTSPK